MSIPLSERLEHARSGAHRLARQASGHEAELQDLVTAAEHQLQEARIALENSSTDSTASVQSVRREISRRSAALDIARRLYLSAREHQLASERLATELGSIEEHSAAVGKVRQAVLVVDDYQDSRDFLSIVLADAGFIVRTATNGLEAVIAAYELQPAVIVMDMMMPYRWH